MQNAIGIIANKATIAILNNDISSSDSLVTITAIIAAIAGVHATLPTVSALLDLNLSHDIRPSLLRTELSIEVAFSSHAVYPSDDFKAFLFTFRKSL